MNITEAKIAHHQSAPTIEAKMIALTAKFFGKKIEKKTQQLKINKLKDEIPKTYEQSQTSLSRKKINIKKHHQFVKHQRGDYPISDRTPSISQPKKVHSNSKIIQPNKFYTERVKSNKLHSSRGKKNKDHFLLKEDFVLQGLPKSRVKRVASGDLVDIKANAHRTFVRVKMEGGGMCTGTVVDYNKVLTAAHCVTRDDTVCTTPDQFVNTSIQVGDETYTCKFDADSIPMPCTRIAPITGRGITEDSEAERKMAKQIDIVMCKTDRPMQNVMPVLMMPKRSLDRIYHKIKYTYDDRAPNNTPFPHSVFVGMGSTSASSNFANNLYVGWVSPKDTSTLNGRPCYHLKSYELTPSKDYLSRPGDSGAGLMSLDLSDGKFKLYAVNARSTEYAGERGEQYADKLIGRSKWENSDEVDLWLQKNELDGSKTFNTTYDLLNDPYFPQPPIRRPDNPYSNISPYTTYTGHCPKADNPPSSLEKNNTLTIQNNLRKSSVFISINCDLYGIKVKFQQDISQEPELKTAMPEGIRLESVDLIINGSCHHCKLESLSIQNIGITLLSDGTGNVMIKGPISELSDSKNSCNISSQYTSPFRLRPHIAVGKSFINSDLMRLILGFSGGIGGIIILTAVCTNRKKLCPQREPVMPQIAEEEETTFIETTGQP